MYIKKSVLKKASIHTIAGHVNHYKVKLVLTSKGTKRMLLSLFSSLFCLCFCVVIVHLSWFKKLRFV